MTSAFRSVLLLGALFLATADGPDMSQGGPVTVTAVDGVDYEQDTQIATARGNAHATRGTTTVIADQLTAHFRKKAGAPTPASKDSDTGSTEVYRLDADGNVTINTPTDIAYGDKAVYDMDQAVLVMTGQHLRMLTPSETITARDRLEYWSNQHLSVARGNALVVAKDGRSVRADVLAAYSDPGCDAKPVPVKPGVTQPAAPPPSTTGAPTACTPGAKSAAPKPAANGDVNPGQLRRVDAFGHVELRTQVDVVDGDKGVYLPQDHLARVTGDVVITRGLNTLRGDDAVVNLQTGIAHMLPSHGTQVHGLLVPSDRSTQNPAAPAKPKATPGTKP